MDDGVLIATGISTAISAAGTLVLAIVAVIQGRQMSAQLAVSERQAKSGETSAKAALDVNKESARSRVDQAAPRVVAFFEPPIGPLMDPLRSGMPYANELRLLDPESIERASAEVGGELAFPADGNSFIWYRGVGVLVNEGESSAFVRLDGESRFTSGVSPLDGQKIQLPYMAGGGIAAEAILPPGSSALFEWAGGHQAQEWADAVERPDPPHPHGAIWNTIVVFDAQRTSTIDTLEAIFSPSPLSPSPRRQGAWKIEAEDPENRVYVQPVTRGYVAEGASTDNPKHQRELYQEFMESERQRG